ncbi:hypothetical protein [Sulfuricurvum sp.]|uniref:hypothetical protein n=1 Tax=Sulfuricurvum sp. TaxID=2025608 RepID=UPI002D2F2ABA|nr:hypothetical protein [Sulfuricurvum sp.]HZF70318.1 hypothetical protein [Sulfuricurvum sp.]
MTQIIGTRELLRNPSLLRIDPQETLIIEDKKAHKTLGIYMGVEAAKEFEAYRAKAQLLESARKIRRHAVEEYNALSESIDDGL